MRIQQPIILKNYSNGVIYEGVVGENLMPQGTVSDVLNMHFDIIGEVKIREGLTIIGSQIVNNKNILGLHQFLDEGTGTDDRLIAVVDTATYYWTGSVWTNIRSGLTTNSKARFTNFTDRIYMVNGIEATQSWDGSSGGSFTTTNLLGAPIAKYIENFRSRVWLANTTSNPSRLQFSSVASSTGTLTWTSTDFIDIAPGDGEDITAIKKYARALYVFKNNFVYRVYSINETDPDPQIFIGTYSQESVELAKDGMYWHHPTGIYRLRSGQPVEISKPISLLIDNIALDFYDDVSSWSDSDHIYFSIGDVTIGTNTITNCVIRWTISSEVWTIYSYSQKLLMGASYNNGTNLVQVVGDDDGNIYTFNSGKTDNGVAIPYKMETKWETLSGLRSDYKTISELVVLHENAQGTEVGWRNGNMLKDEIKVLGNLEGQETIFSTDITGNRIKLSIRGSSTGDQLTFQGFEILDWNIIR